MNMNKTLNKYILVSMMAMAVNILIFTGYPNLLPDQAIPTDIEYLQQVDFIKDMPEEKPEKPRDPEREETFKERPLQPKQIKSFTQKNSMDLNMDIPDIELSAAPEIDMGVTIPAPGLNKGPSLKGYYDMGEVDQEPMAIVKSQPMYPYRARRLNIEGEVDVKFLVDKNGNVSQVTVLKATPPDIFDQSVRDTVTRWRFEPGKVNGQQVNTWMITTIEFQMSGR